MAKEKLKLPDGRTLAFHHLREQDLPQLIPVFNSIIQEGIYFHRNEGLPDLETAQKWYDDQIKARMIFTIVRVDNQLVGGASLKPGRGKASHVASLGIYLRKDFRNRGIGTRLMGAIIHTARERNFEIVKLMVFASNKRAIHLYEEFGFQECGRIKNGVKFPDGTYTDDIIMTLSLKKA